MFVRHHNQRTKKPKIPAAIQVRDEPALVLAERDRTTEQAVWKWRKRDGFRDHSPPSSDHPDTSARGRGSCTAQNVTVVTGRFIDRGARVSEPDYISFGFRSLSASAWSGTSL